MKILMIMPLFTGLKPVVHGNGKPVGMPDVYKLLEGLAKTNHEGYVIFMGTERNGAFTPKEVKERFFQNTLDSNINIMGIRLPFSGFFDRISGVKGPGQFNSTPGVLAFLKMPLKFYGLTMELYSLVRLARIVRHIKPSVIYGAAGWSMVAFLLGKLFRLATIKRQ